MFDNPIQAVEDKLTGCQVLSNIEKEDKQKEWESESLTSAGRVHTKGIHPNVNYSRQGIAQTFSISRKCSDKCKKGFQKPCITRKMTSCWLEASAGHTKQTLKVQWWVKTKHFLW